MIKSVNSYSPAFGMARLNNTGRNAAQNFGMPENDFLNGDLYRRQGLFKKSAMSIELAQGRNFVDLCKEYGCTNIGKANAEFIETQILSGKSDRAIKSVSQGDLQTGFLALYHSNYDNPDLSLKSTKSLLKKIKDYIAPEEYIKNIGLLSEGAE